MNKYIDAGKLIAEIEQYKQGAAIARFDNAGENADYFQCKVDLCDDLMHIITSLQQEATAIAYLTEIHLTPTNGRRAILEVPNPPRTWGPGAQILCLMTPIQEQPSNEDDGKFVKISVRKEFAEQFQKLGDEIQAGQSSFIGAMNQQEQPEVDLNDIIRVEFGTRAKVEGGKRYVKLDWNKFGILAYHFYALGQQSRISKKEE